MQIKTFIISVYDNGESLEEMNRFLHGNKILNINEELISNGKGGGYWTYSVQYLGRMASAKESSTKKSTIDYKKELDEATFIKYAKLRECRKKINEQNGVPLYAIFTNAELAKIASLEELTLAKMGSVEGVSKGKLTKYGQQVLGLYKDM